jgi:hypothetical protein
VIQAPWTEEQVAALNAFQQRAPFHPFTCGYRDDHYAANQGILVATTTGWVCPYRGCQYTQDWASPFMMDPHWVTCRGGMYHTFQRCEERVPR